MYFFLKQLYSRVFKNKLFQLSKITNIAFALMVLDKQIDYKFNSL